MEHLLNRCMEDDGIEGAQDGVSEVEWTSGEFLPLSSDAKTSPVMQIAHLVLQIAQVAPRHMHNFRPQDNRGWAIPEVA